MQYADRRVGDVVIVDLAGKATFGAPGLALRQIVAGLLERGERNVLLDMTGVGYMDSGGLGDLVVSFVKMSRCDGQLKLLNLGDKHRHLLELTGLIDVIPSFSDEAEALASFDID